MPVAFAARSSTAIALSDGGPTSPPPPPPAAAGTVLRPYRAIGSITFGGSVGEIHDEEGYWYRFSVATTGDLEELAVWLQGARPNQDFGQTYSKRPYGRHRMTIHRYTGPGSPGVEGMLPVDNIGSSDHRTKIGQAKEDYYPGWPDGPEDTTFNPFETAPGEHGADHPQGTGNGFLKGGVKVQSFTRGALKGKNGNTTWNSTIKYAGCAFLDVPVGVVTNSVWTQGIPVTIGEIILVQIEDIPKTTYDDEEVDAGYCCDNTVFMAGGPTPRPDLSIATPLDPALGCFNSGGGRAWRQSVPYYGQKIGTRWYGQPHLFGSSKGDGPFGRGDEALITSTQWVRMVITPDEDFEAEICNAIWWWGWKVTGSLGNNTVGNLQLSAWQADFVADGAKDEDGDDIYPTFAQIGSWVSIAGSLIKTCDGHPHSLKTVIGSGKPSEANIFKQLGVSIPDLTIDKNHHYAIVSRSSNGAVFGTSGLLSGAVQNNERSDRDIMRADGVWPRLWQASNDNRGRRFNKPQISTNSGTSWGGYNSDGPKIVLPYAFYPKA